MPTLKRKNEEEDARPSAAKPGAKPGSAAGKLGAKKTTIPAAKPVAKPAPQTMKPARQFDRPMEDEARATGGAPVPPPAPAVKIIAKHKVTDDDDLTTIALKYYKRAIKEYWMYIYEHNKAVIGDNPRFISPGMVLEIPELTQALKDIPIR